MISPSFVLPFLMIPIGAWAGVLTGNFWLLQGLGAFMTGYGLYVCYLMLRRPDELAVEENHVSWAHMYRMMFVRRSVSRWPTCCRTPHVGLRGPGSGARVDTPP